MKSEQLFEYFDELADRLNVKIINGKGDFHGGACTINDRNVIVVNKVKPIEQRLRVLATEFSKLDLSGIYIIPALRSYIDEFGTSLFSAEEP